MRFAIENCYANADISSSGNYVGGICGQDVVGSISKCYASGTVFCGGTYAGGILGGPYADSNSISSCAALQSSITATSSAGRVSGVSSTGLTISSCYAWDGMTVNGAAVAAGDTGVSTLNGANLTAAAALAPSTYTVLGWTAYNVSSAPYGWALENGKLPYIQPFGEVTASQYAYLTDASGGDETAPALSGASCTAAGATYATFAFTSDEAGTYYCRALPAADAAPTADTIKSSGLSGSATASVNTFSIGGLTASTSYEAYLIVTDASGNTSEITTITFTTGDKDETAAPPYLNGAYRIGTAAQLAWFRDLVSGTLTDGTAQNTSANAVLTAEIDLSSVCDSGTSWAPIGNSSGAYSGTFDGAGYTVSNLYISSASDSQALFGYVNNSTISNLTVKGSVTSTGSNAAGIAANAMGSNFTGCRNEAAVSGKSYVGGIAGNAPSASFSGCVNTGAVSGQTSYAGGIAGTGKSFSGCSNSGVISGTAQYTGGIVGSTNVSANVTLTNCENTAAITGAGYVGGIAGYLASGTSCKFTVTGCANSGTVTCAYVGTAGNAVGGLFGYANIAASSNASAIAGSYSTGAVSDTSGSTDVSGAGNLGGGVYSVSASVTIKNSYGLGSVSGGDGVGGLLGSVSAGSSTASVTVKNCYSAAGSLSGASSSASIGGGIGKTSLSGGATSGCIVLSNVFYLDSAASKGLGSNTAGVDPCCVGARLIVS